MLRFGIVVLYCGDSGKIGYYNNQEIGIAKAMSKRGYDCYVFYPSFDEGKKHLIEKMDGVTIVKCPAKRIGVHSFYDWNVLLKFKINVAHVGGDNQMFAPNVLNFCKRHGIICYTYSGVFESGNANIIKKAIMDFALMRNVRAYKRTYNFVKTQAVMQSMTSRKVKVQKPVIPVGLDLSIIPEIREDKMTLRNKLHIPENKKVLLFVGRIDEYKRPMEMIDLMAELTEDYYGILIGNGKLAHELEDKIHKYGLEDRILWQKEVPNSEIHDYYKASDYLLNFNPNEIFGMCLLEALYQGCTVIAVHAPGPDLILKDRHGFLVNGRNEMKEIMDQGTGMDPSESRNYVMNQFSWDNAAKEFDLHIQKRLAK